MGEHADAMLHGLACAKCGEWFDDVIAGAKEPGYPRLCAGCDGKTTRGDEVVRPRFTVIFGSQCGHDGRYSHRAVVWVATPAPLTAEERKTIDEMVGDFPRYHRCPYCERARFNSLRALGQHAYHAHQRKVTRDGGPTS